jgi:hypothetical protein
MVLHEAPWNVFVILVIWYSPHECSPISW